MSGILEITGSPTFDNSIIRKEYRTYSPFVDCYKNNDEIRIAIQNQDLILLLSDSYLNCTLTYTIPPNNEAAQIVNAKLQNNFMAFMFEEIRYEMNGYEIDRVRNPGITTTLKNYHSLSKSESDGLAYTGWVYENDENNPNTNAKFDVCLPLKKLLGFCEDYNKVLLGSTHELILVRSKSDNNSVFLTAGTDYKLSLDKLQWKVPIIQVSDVEKFALMKVINRDQFITMPFRGWSLNELPALPPSNKHIWNVKNSTQIEKPRFIIFGLQTDRKNKIEKDSSMFDHNDLGSVRAYLNSNPYPSEEVRFNFQESFSQVYDAYLKFRKVYYGSDTYPLLTMSMLRKQGLVFIDCSHQEDGVKSGNVDLSIHFETSDGSPFKPLTTAYCLILYDKILQYNPLTNVVRKIE